MTSLPLVGSAILTILFVSVCARTQDASEKSLHLPVQARIVVRGLDKPSAIAAGPGGTLYVAESGGRIRALADGRLSEPLAGVPDGLLDLIFHPDFAENDWVYLSYTVGSPNGPHVRVARYDLVRERLENGSVLMDGPAGGGDDGRFGGRMCFGADGKLYVALGERNEPDRAQDLDVLHGKVARIDGDGSVPEDNPFADAAGIRPEIFSFGHRDPQGIGVHPVSGKLYLVENGPADEINALYAKGNYGWPWVYHQSNQEGMIPPLRVYTPALEPSGAVFYTGGKIPHWTNDFFFTSLRGQALVRLRFDEGRIVEEEKLFSRKFGRLRDVAGGGDGYLYLLSENGEIIRVEPGYDSR